MNTATWVLLGMLMNGCSSQDEVHPSIKCVAEIGPPIDWTIKHKFTPSDIHNLGVKIVEAQGTCKFNISWILEENGSIQYLNATRLCVSTSGHPTCIRCDYAEKFQSQTMPNYEKWHFFYVGFHVEENTAYTISAYNLPSANLDEDPSSRYIFLTSPDCEDDLLKYDTNCKEKGIYLAIFRSSA